MDIALDSDYLTASALPLDGFIMAGGFGKRGGLHPGDTLEFFKCCFAGQLYRYAYLVSIANPERFEQLRQYRMLPGHIGRIKRNSVLSEALLLLERRN